MWGSEMLRERELFSGHWVGDIHLGGALTDLTWYTQTGRIFHLWVWPPLVTFTRLLTYSEYSRAPSSQECIYIPHHRHCKRLHCGSCKCGCSSDPSGQADRLKTTGSVERWVGVSRSAPKWILHPLSPSLLPCTRLIPLIWTIYSQFSW